MSGLSLSPTTPTTPPSYLPPHMEAWEDWYRRGVPWHRAQWLPAADLRALTTDIAERGIAAAECAGRLYNLVATYKFTPEDSAAVVRAASQRYPLPASALAQAVETARITALALDAASVTQVVSLLAALPVTDVAYLARTHFLQALLPPLKKALDLQHKLAPLPANFAIVGPSTLASSSSASSASSSSSALSPHDLQALALAVHPKAVVLTCNHLLVAFPGTKFDTASFAHLLAVIPFDVVVPKTFVAAGEQQPRSHTVSLRLAFIQFAAEHAALPLMAADEQLDLLRHVPGPEQPDAILALLPVLAAVTSFAALHGLLKLVTPEKRDGVESPRMLVFRAILRAKLAQNLGDLAVLPAILYLFLDLVERLQAMHACLHRAVPPSLDESSQLVERFPQGADQRATAFGLIVEVWAPPVRYADLQALLALVASPFRKQALAAVDRLLPPVAAAELVGLLRLVPNQTFQRLDALEMLLPHAAAKLTVPQLGSLLAEFDPGRNRLDALSRCVLSVAPDAAQSAAQLDRLFPSLDDRRKATDILRRAGF